MSQFSHLQMQPHIKCFLSQNNPLGMLCINLKTKNLLFHINNIPISQDLLPKIPRWSQNKANYSKQNISQIGFPIIIIIIHLWHSWSIVHPYKIIRFNPTIQSIASIRPSVVYKTMYNTIVKESTILKSLIVLLKYFPIKNQTN